MEGKKIILSNKGYIYKSESIINTMSDENQEYSPINDNKRLKIQADMYKNRDPKYIKNITEYLDKNNIEPPYKVLDAGCGFGYMTKEIFGNDNKFEVIGVDKSKKKQLKKQKIIIMPIILPTKILI